MHETIEMLLGSSETANHVSQSHCKNLYNRSAALLTLLIPTASPHYLRLSSESERSDLDLSLREER
jgi:hypothetical protein